MYPLEADHYERAVQPTLLINAGRWQWDDNIKKMHRLNQDTALRLVYTLRDGVHQTFTDFPFLVGPFFGKRFNLQGETEVETSMEAIVEISVSFLRRVHENNTVQSAINQLVEQKYSKFVIEGFDRDFSGEDIK
uniref:1-alkyl-2-acetylglycerophosphocholine esterase n=1 Tax=Heterorhabditis bacteriophora TaxID=37862 RepID=A0A1I7XH47_HETBA